MNRLIPPLAALALATACLVPPALAEDAGAIRRALASRTDLTPGDSAVAIKELRGVAVGDWITTDEQIAAIMPHLSR